jgi:hypothetical protein
MESQFHPSHALSATPSRCPFHDGPATLDALLAELATGNSPDALDLALDLRCALVERIDADACVALALRLRRTLNGAHYLAFYRVRLWMQRVIAVQVRGWRGDDWTTFDLPLNSARTDEIENACRSAWAIAREIEPTEWTQVRFVFRPRSVTVADPTVGSRISIAPGSLAAP